MVYVNPGQVTYFEETPAFEGRVSPPSWGTASPVSLLAPTEHAASAPGKKPPAARFRRLTALRRETARAVDTAELERLVDHVRLRPASLRDLPRRIASSLLAQTLVLAPALRPTALRVLLLIHDEPPLAYARLYARHRAGQTVAAATRRGETPIVRRWRARETSGLRTLLESSYRSGLDEATLRQLPWPSSVCTYETAPSTHRLEVHREAHPDRRDACGRPRPGGHRLRAGGAAPAGAAVRRLAVRVGSTLDEVPCQIAFGRTLIAPGRPWQPGDPPPSADALPFIDPNVCRGRQPVVLRRARHMTATLLGQSPQVAARGSLRTADPLVVRPSATRRRQSGS